MIIEVIVPISANINISVDDQKEKSPFWPKWVTPSKVKAIQQLPIFAMVHEMILLGHPDNEIARSIQAHGYMDDIELNSVINYVAHYKATVPKSLILLHNTPKHVLDAKSKLDEQLDVISEQDWLYRIQKTRLQKALEAEQMTNYIIPNLDKEIDLAAKLLERSVKIRKDAGFNDPEIFKASKKDDRFGVDLDRIYSKEGITEKLTDPKTRLKILGAVESLLAIAQKKSEVIDIQSKASDESVEVSDIDQSILDEINSDVRKQQ